ncbi:hypothetical protein WOLCODRAFT_147386 [Wolfiporia cocos MD-104 SS10]|uniref:Uncharacterized protein n=1 Tax=Wolfiporia cocos (strain MD-104) TaxID=742152 RepID=A0A2H3IV30_WOLCO|nr:hypothetical protein WOLCODRAFT_147386 [Wolfiporia cocos MD-104 SS10]
MPPSIPITISMPTPSPIEPVTISMPTPTRTPTPLHDPMPPLIVHTPPPTYDHPTGPQLPTHSRVSTSPHNTIVQINNILCCNLDWTIINHNDLMNHFFTTLEYTTFLERILNSVHVLNLDWINPAIPPYKQASSIRMTFCDYPDGCILQTLQDVLLEFNIDQPTSCFHGRLSMKIIATPVLT